MAAVTVTTSARPRPFSWLRDLYDRAAVMHDLFLADSRDLRDLGISTCDFDSIANGSFRR